MSLMSTLAEVHPGLCEEWSDRNLPLTPEQVGASSDRRVWWKCRKSGCEWLAPVSSRSRGTGCPYCAGRTPMPGVNDLATMYPEIAAQWSDRNLPDKPEDHTAHSGKRYWWKCPRCGGEWYTSINHRTNGHGCPVCAGKRVRRGTNDLATVCPDIAAEWDYERNGDLRPEDVGRGSQKYVWWKCSVCGNEYQRHVHHRTSGAAKCPYCNFHYLKTGFNDLATTDPQLAAEWDPDRNGEWTPNKVMRTQRKFVWWKCRYGHSFGERIIDRTVGGKDCSFCENEFRAALPQMLLLRYAGMASVPVEVEHRSGRKDVYEIWFPDQKLAVELEGFSEYVRQQQLEKMERAAGKGIRYRLVSKSRDGVRTAEEIANILADAGICIDTDPEDDVKLMRKQFFEIKDELMNTADEEVQDGGYRSYDEETSEDPA